MTDILSLINYANDDAVSNWVSTSEAAAKNSHLFWQPYCGGFVVTRPGRILIPETECLAKEAEYLAHVAADKAVGDAKSKLEALERDAERIARMLEDLHAGLPIHEKTQAWLDERAAARAAAYPKE